MKTAVLSCKVTERELRRAMEEVRCEHDVIWIDDGLHDVPKKLNAVLSETLASLTAYDRVLMTMGECGGAIAGLKTGAFELIYPRTDDCITLLLGSGERRRELNHRAMYFMTEGWLNGSRNLVTEYEHSVQKYGEEMAEVIIETMFANYRYLALLDTGTENIDSLYERTAKTAELLGLERIRVEASLSWMKELLTGPWRGGRFEVIPPFSEVRQEQVGLPRGI